MTMIGTSLGDSRASSRRWRCAVGSMLVLSPFLVSWVWKELILRDVIPLCPFRIATRHPCPLCGLTRAMAYAVHGQWWEAWQMNPLWPVFAIALASFAALLQIDAFTGWNTAGRVGRALSEKWIYILGGVGGVGVVRFLG